MANSPRPRYQKKSDRLITPGATEMEIRCDMAMLPFDRLAREMDRKWGIDRIAGLVSPAMAAKYGGALAHLNAAIDSADPAATAAAAENCMKGMRAMDAEATQLGHHPITPAVWEHECDDGSKFCVIRDTSDWPAAQAAFPALTIYTMREIANAMAGYIKSVAAVKDAFPGAEISAVRKRTPTEEYLDDDLPF